MMRSLLTNHPLVNILFTVVMVMGALAYFSMPREQDPEINFNWVNINTVLPGASATDVEQLVTGPLEDSLRNVQDIRFISSHSREGVSNILVRFHDIAPRIFDKRMNDLRREIQNKTNEELPAEVEDPFIFEVTTSNGFPTALVVVSGPALDDNLRLQARQIKEDLEQISGVDRIQAQGLSDPELVVEFDAHALAQRGLRASEIADSLRSGFRDTFAGNTRVGDVEWLTRIEGSTADPEALARYVVAPRNDPTRKIALEDVADIRRDRKIAQQLISFEGRPAVSLGVTKVGYTNTLDLIERISEYVERKNELLAGTGLSVIVADDQTVQTRQALGVMQTNAALGLTLVLGVCWLFLGIRIATMVTLGIAFSIAGAFWVLQMTGNTLNVSVLLGIVIVLGMLVDDAVVVVEAVYYRLQRGIHGVEAAIGALQEVGKPVASAVATTMAAFLPLMLLPGIVGKFMFVIPFVVTVGLAVSLIEAFWILPAHVISLGPRAAGNLQHPGLRERVTRRVRLKYAKALAFVMRRPAWLFTGAILAVALAATAVARGLIKVDFFTFDPMRIFYVNVDMPADAPLERTLRKTVEVEQRVREFVQPAEIRAITSLSGVKFTEVEPLYGDQYGQIQVSLNPRNADGRSVSDIVDSMRDAMARVPGDATISFLEISGGPPTTSPINIKVRADDFDELRAAADAIKAIVAGIPGAIDIVDNDVPGRQELVLEVDQEAVRRAGLEPGDVARALRLHVDGEIVAFMRDRGEKVELRVRGSRNAVNEIDQVLDDPIALPGGGVAMLSSLVTAERGSGRGNIRHYNLRRSITVSADLEAETTDTVAANNMLLVGWEKVRDQFPNTNLDQSGELDDIEESLDAMAGLFLLGLGLIYLILATQFRSYFQPLLILVTVPMAFTGVVVGLLLTGNPLSLYTMYGVIALTGIAVNSAIVLIDAANSRIKAGMRPLHATVYAAKRRVIPVLMTTFTTIAGLFSLAAGLGGKSLLWGPVASSIVAGLMVATALTLFVIPTLYRQFMKGAGEHAQ